MANNFFAGVGSPASGLGAGGDYYLDLNTNQRYGPKTANPANWGSPIPFLTQGAQGVPGATGAQGEPGSVGPAGQDGSPGNSPAVCAEMNLSQCRDGWPIIEACIQHHFLSYEVGHQLFSILANTPGIPGKIIVYAPASLT